MISIQTVPGFAGAGIPNRQVLLAPLEDMQALAEQYEAVRGFTRTLCEPLATEDYVIQTMTDVSPTKWHLAHTTWFFETFVLKQAFSDYEPHDPIYEYLFNSYYNAVGQQYPRPRRGLLSRPTVLEVYEYRDYVDDQIERLFEKRNADKLEKLAYVLLLGLQHEQQHQELMVTDFKHVLCNNPTQPVYHGRHGPPNMPAPKLQWVDFPEGIREIGFAGEGFSYDNEGPRHRVFLEPFALASRLATCGEYKQFMEDGGYERSELWLSEGWATVQNEQWRHPLYWEQESGDWMQMTLNGFRRVADSEPVCHLSYFEADAFARWSDARLPTEAEFEIALDDAPVEGNLVEQMNFHPVPASSDGRLEQLYGDVWEWTSSSYSPYPGYRAEEGALGEYNGKFMCNQYVLRGGSCATSISHIRPSYRNFFPAYARWQFSGVRLARST